MTEKDVSDQLLRLSTIASTDAFTVSNSDNPNANIGPLLFDGDNFLSWSRQVRMALGAKIKLGFIDGSIAPLKDSSSDYTRWLRNDQMVACWIFNTMKPEIACSFVYTTSVRDVWLEILDRFSQGSASLRYQLKQESMRILQGTLSVTAYYEKLKKCWDDLQSIKGIPMCDCGVMVKCSCFVLRKIMEQESEDQLLHFFINLNAEYDSIKSQILATDPLPSLGKAYYMVLQVEKQRKISTTVQEPSAFMAGSIGSSRGDSRRKLKDDKKHCSICQKDGNLAETCFEVVGYPDWYKGKKNVRTSKIVANVSQDTCASDSPLDASIDGTAFLNLIHYKSLNNEWILDTGATDHMSPYVDQLSDLRNLSPPVVVRLLDGSVQKDRSSRTVVAQGQVTGGLYKLAAHFQDTRVSSNDSVVSNTFCDTCSQSKFHRLPFPSSVSRSVATFDLLHMDLWGPFNTASLNGEKYLFTIVDYMSRATWTYLMHTKDQVYDIVKSFFCLVNTQFGKKPKIVRSDGGSELLNSLVDHTDSPSAESSTLTDGSMQIPPIPELRRSTRSRNVTSWCDEYDMAATCIQNSKAKAEHLAFLSQGDGKFMATLVYVNDILITRNDDDDIKHVKATLDSKFTIKDLGLAKYFLGMEIFTNAQGTHISQHKYITDTLQAAQVEDATAVHFPLPTGLKLRLDQGVLLEDGEQYRRLVGRLLYLSLTRPDLSYAVQHLSQFVSQPQLPHFQAAIHVLRYLKVSMHKGLFYPVQRSLKMVGFSDADWGSCLTTRRSLTGYCVFLGQSLVSWKTKKQAIVSRSSTEAEYRSMAATTAEIVWMSYLLNDLHIEVPLPITLFCDNKVAQQIAANPCYHESTKHLELDAHFVREKVQGGFLQTAYIHTSMQIADIMTKALGIKLMNFSVLSWA
ncbi:hypothetical protein V2J09_015594 [Rumex salicifolius]